MRGNEGFSPLFRAYRITYSTTLEVASSFLFILIPYRACGVCEPDKHGSFHAYSVDTISTNLDNIHHPLHQNQRLRID